MNESVKHVGYNFDSTYLYSRLRTKSIMIPNVTLANFLQIQSKINDMDKSLIFMDENKNHSIALFIACTFMISEFTDILVVYEKDEDLESWKDNLSMMISENDYMIHIIDTSQQEITDDLQQKEPVVHFVFVKLNHLCGIFPRRMKIRDLVPYVTEPDTVDAALTGSLFYTNESSRLGVASRPFKRQPNNPLGDKMDPYSFDWSCVLFDMHDIEFEQRLNVAYVINGLCSQITAFFMDALTQSEDPSCLHALVAMARPTNRSSYEYKLDDVFVMSSFVIEDYYTIDVDANFDNEILTTVVKIAAEKKRTRRVITRETQQVASSSYNSESPAVLSTSYSSKISSFRRKSSWRRVSQDHSIEKQRFDVNFSTLIFWIAGKGIVERQTGNQNRLKLLFIQDSVYIEELQKSSLAIKSEWIHETLKTYKNITSREWMIKRRLDALIRFFNDRYTTKFYLLVDCPNFPGISKLTNNVTVIKEEKKTHLALPPDSNVVIFNPVMTLKRSHHLFDTRYTLFVPAVDYWLELKIAYHFLQKICFNERKSVTSVKYVPFLIERKTLSFTTPTKFEKTTIPVFYYDSLSKKYDSFYEFMIGVREKTCNEIFSVIRESTQSREAVKKALFMFKKAQVVYMSTVPLCDVKLSSLQAKGRDAKMNGKTKSLAVYKHRHRKTIVEKLPDTSEEYDAVVKNYSKAVDDSIEAHIQFIERSKFVFLPSDSVSFYATLNPERESVLLSYNNQTPPLSYNSLCGNDIWTRPNRKKTKCTSRTPEVVEYFIPCDPCRRVFKIHEEYQKHILTRDHKIHVAIAAEELKFLNPLPMFDNKKKGCLTTQPTCLNIMDLWKPEYKTYICVLCSIVCNTPAYLLKHYRHRTHISRMENKTQMIRSCEACNFSSQKSVEKAVHEASETHKKETRLFTCQLCLLCHYGHTTYTKHVNECFDKAVKKSVPLVSFLNGDSTACEFSCFVCKKRYNGYKTFSTHWDSSGHKENMSLFLKETKRCIVCENVFYSISDFEFHLQTNHQCAVNQTPRDVIENNLEDGHHNTGMEVTSSPSSSSSSSSSIMDDGEEEAINVLKNLNSEENENRGVQASSESSSESSSSSLTELVVPSSSTTQQSNTVRGLALLSQQNQERYRIYFNKIFIYCSMMFELYETDPQKYKHGDLLTSFFINLESKMDMEDISSFMTLEAIRCCLSKKNATFYLSEDETSGILLCDLKGKMGIVGHFGNDLKPLIHRILKDHGIYDSQDNLIGITFNYIPNSITETFREVITFLRLELLLDIIEKDNIVNDLFHLYFKLMVFKPLKR